MKKRVAKLGLLGALSSAFCMNSVAAPQNKIEIVQAVQSMDQDVRLVAGKTTIVRVYLDGAENKDVNVTGRMEVTRTNSGKTLMVDAANSVEVGGAQSASLIEQHDDIRKSLNFVVPAQWTDSGTCNLHYTILGYIIF